ncbi:hypothetical protein [Terrabacter sp. 2YAF2]|uniref:hypothetical protein n=1 Tax=Terrabacter sp. 2YAF2 TaxID=3233026 RepID=UPI003F985B71
MNRVFLLSDLAGQTTLQFPAPSPEATLTWEWYAQDAAVYRLLIWSSGLTD